MSDAQASDTHGDAAGHDHDDQGAEPLGEIDVTSWGAAVVGASLSVLLIIAMYIAIQS